MTPIAPHMSAFLRERLPLQRGASGHTCDSYAYAFQLLFQFASERLQMTPSALALEQLDAPLIMEFLHSLETARHNSPRTRNARLVAIKSFMHFPAGTQSAYSRHPGQENRYPAGALSHGRGDAKPPECAGSATARRHP